ncbi:MAG: hypothetical protein M3331_07170 [Actinomycetota bacterium]|nr:hypothetical protein [Actinomycetota bacterium]
MRIGLGRRREERADRVTLGLAALAAGTAGTVAFGELAKLARRRVREAAEDPTVATPETVLETAEQAIVSTQLATQDAVAVAIEGYAATPRAETVLFNLLTGFVGALVGARVSTHGMRGGWWPLGNVELAGRHIHHFVPGILLGFGAGATALLTEDEKLEEKLAIPFGVGVGLTLDEAALLLDLRDVYWTREGVLSVQVSFGATALLAGTILALRILRRGERRTEAIGVIPAPI